MNRVIFVLGLLYFFGCNSDDGLKAYNTDPSANITSHQDGDILLEGVDITFVGFVSDANHQNQDLLVTWQTEQRELCPAQAPQQDGNTTCVAQLEEGETQIRLQVVDPQGAAYVEIIDITVQGDEAPSAQILSPSASMAYYSDQLVYFSALVTDTEDEPQDLSYEWSSNLDGVLPITLVPDSSGSIEQYAALSEGQHSILLQVEDSSGQIANDVVAITVGPPNSLPECYITSPSSSSSFEEEEFITFSGIATDADVDNRTLNIAWYSDIDGVFDTNPPSIDGGLEVLISGLSNGEHLITLDVADETGASCQATTSVLVGSACGQTGDEEFIDLGDGVSMTMALIPAGDDPQGRYTLTNDFYMMTTEVTQAMFLRFMSYSPHIGCLSCPGSDNPLYGSIGDNKPMYQITRARAQDFANKMTLHYNIQYGTNLQYCYDCSNAGTENPSCSPAVNPYECSGFALPTEAEWEYAARSGTEFDFWTLDGGGDTDNEGFCDAASVILDGFYAPLVSAYARFCADNGNQWPMGADDVGQRLPNCFGLYDMHGNVEEVMHDNAGCSLSDSPINPVCEVGTYSAIYKGGHWNDSAISLGASVRKEFGIAYADTDTGMRLVRRPITKPSAPKLLIAASSTSDDVFCEITQESQDPEGNSVTYTFSWEVNGNAHTGNTMTTTYSGDTISASQTQAGDVWSCSVTPNDGTEDGFVGTATVSIPN